MTRLRILRRRRDKQRGTATIEMALSLIVVLLPLVLGMMDYGYYFFVSSTAAEAARVAARATSTSATPSCANVAAVTAAATAGRTAATAYMNTIGLGGTSNLVVDITCGTVAGPPVLTPFWTVTVKVSFPPAIGFIKSLMKQSTTTPGWVLFVQTVRILGG